MMKCKVFRYEGIICTILLFIASIVSSHFKDLSKLTIQELCTSNNYIYNLAPQESKYFQLTSSDSGEISKWYQKLKRRCRKEFKTNNGASHFVVFISNMSIPSCSAKCQCNYFEIAEPGHNEKFCGEQKEVYFELKSDYFSLEFHHGFPMTFEVTLEIKVQRNTYFLSSLASKALDRGHVIETPYFPNTYQSDYISEYILRSNSLDGHVVLVFLDFSIAHESFIEITGQNGTRPDRFNGKIFRPPAIVSRQNQLNLRFEANNAPGFSGSGFRALAYFVKDFDVEMDKPNTSCGGSKNNYGGMLFIESFKSHAHYDCLWLIAPPLLAQTKSYFLSVTVTSWENIGTQNMLEFREGLNSKSKLVKSIDCSLYNCSQLNPEVTVSAFDGLYIRFTGPLDSNFTLKMVYSTYHDGNCSEGEFACNERCLPSVLHCDGVKHCPGGSDEEECTVATTLTMEANEPSVFQSKVHSSHAIASFHIVLSFGILGLIVICVAIFFIICRLFKVRVLDARSTTPVGRGNGITGAASTNGRSSPSCSGCPPSYDEFIWSSDFYPPPLYTRAGKRYSEPNPAVSSSIRTTSFCTRPHSLDSVINSSSSTDESCVHIPGSSNTEVLLNEFLPSVRKPGIKKSSSWDTELDRTCHLHLSITHSVECGSSHSDAVTIKPECRSLPSNMRINELGPDNVDITFKTQLPVSGRDCSSCLFRGHSLGARPEIMTRVKARCYSEPGKKVRVHCSFIHQDASIA